MRHTGTTSYLPLNLFRVDDLSLLVDGAFSSGGLDPAGRDPRGGFPGRDVKGVCLVDFFQGETARFDEAAGRVGQRVADRGPQGDVQEVDVDTTEGEYTSEDEKNQGSNIGCDLGTEESDEEVWKRTVSCVPCRVVRSDLLHSQLVAVAAATPCART